MKRHVVICLGLVATLSLVTGAQEAGGPRPAVPVEPIVGILGAFRSHQVVMLPGGFGDERRRLLDSLLRDARIQATVTDIVVEFGNYRYQDLMDRFVRGDDVPDQDLRKVWEQSTVRANEPGRLEELFRTVRDINRGLARDRQLRVLLGEPPIDVDNVPEPADRRRWVVLRDSFPADLIRREVVVRGRRALVLYGQLHYLRKQILSNYDCPTGRPRRWSVGWRGWEPSVVSRFVASTTSLKFLATSSRAYAWKISSTRFSTPAAMDAESGRPNHAMEPTARGILSTAPHRER